MAYTKIKELGRGGFGRVYEVCDGKQETFAMKEFSPNAELQAVIDKGIVSLEDLKKRFFKEVKYQSRVKSRNVVKIIGSNLENVTPWYVMELGVGTLQDDLIADRTLGNNLKTALFDILAGLEAIHDLGITHRDLKPVNVLKFIEADGSVRYAISDFGLITAVASDTTTITQTGHAGGTPIYAAPELITNFKYATTTADIYSFGAILHDIFGSGSRTPYVELSVPGPCRTIVEKCTKKNPLRRYQDITSLRIDVFEALNSPDLNFSSTDEAEIIKLLSEKEELSDDEWDRFFEVLDCSTGGYQTSYNLFRSIMSGHISSLASTSPDLFNALGMRFSEYVRSNSHTFDYCDVLADKLERFFNFGSISLKAHTLISLLKMGVSHNRWFVERKLLNLAGPSLDSKVANRVLLDVEADSFSLGYYLSCWEASIGANRLQLHPLIARGVDKT
jgi:serine/threonine protein kinase